MEEHVKCPICNKQFRIIYTNHLKKHNYNSREEILKDYPDMKFYSEWLSNKNRDTANQHFTTEESRERSRKLMKETSNKLFSNPEYRKQYKNMKKELWKTKEFREKFNNSRWTEERREEFRQWSIKSNKERLKDPEYRERNARQFSSIGSHGIKTTYNGKHLKSSYELKVIKFLDEETNIKYEYEPFLIEYELDGKIHNYIPDIYIKELNLIIEIKPEYKLKDKEVIEKENASINKGYNYKYLTENDLDNLKEYFNSLFESSTTIESITN